MNAKFKVFLCLSLAVVFSAATATAGQYEKDIDKTFDFEKGERFSLDNTNGRVTIEGWDRDKARITATKVVKARGSEEAEELFEMIKIEFEETSRGLRIKTRLPKSSDGGGFFSWIFDGDNRRQTRVDYDIKLPNGAEAVVETVNGRIYLADFEGEMRLETTNGGIEVENASGDIEASSTNGRINVELVDVDNDPDIHISTTNGGIQLALPASYRGRLDARTTNGRLRSDIDVAAKLNRGWSRKTLNGEIGNGDGRCELRAVNGSISIRKSTS